MFKHIKQYLLAIALLIFSNNSIADNILINSSKNSYDSMEELSNMIEKDQFCDFQNITPKNYPEFDHSSKR